MIMILILHMVKLLFGVPESSFLVEQDETPLHEYFTSIGVYINNYSKKIRISNNTLKNMSGKGVYIISQYNDSLVDVTNNKISSNIQGSYLLRREEAGSGIYLQKTSKVPVNGAIRIHGNMITFDKPDSLWGNCLRI